MEKQTGIASPRRAARALRTAALFALLAACGCTSVVDGPLYFTDAGKYQFYNCDQLATAAKTQFAREQELKSLIERAEQGPGGALVSVIAYQSEYVAAGEERRIIEATSRSKNCLTAETWQSNAAIQ